MGMSEATHKVFDTSGLSVSSVELDSGAEQTLNLVVELTYSYENLQKTLEQIGPGDFYLVLEVGNSDYDIAKLTENNEGKDCTVLLNPAKRYWNLYYRMTDEEYKQNYVDPGYFERFRYFKLEKAKFRYNEAKIRELTGRYADIYPSNMKALPSSEYGSRRYEITTYNISDDGFENGTIKFSNIKVNIPEVAGNYNLKIVYRTEKSKINVVGSGFVTANISGEVLKDISINTSSVKTTFNYGETFDYSGLVVTASYKAKNSGDDIGSKTTTGYTVSTPSMTTVGEQTVTVSYSENGITKTVEYQITVIGVEKITFDEPTKTQFIIGSTISGFPEHAYAVLGDETEVIDITEDNCTYSFSVLGPTTVVVSVVSPSTNEPFTYSYGVDVVLEDGALHVYSVETNIENLKFDKNDVFNLDGYEVTIIMSDGSSIVGTISDDKIEMEDGTVATITGGNPYGIGDEVSSSKKYTNAKLNILYLGMTGVTDSFTVDVVYIDSISITTNPTKTTYYVGEKIDYTGIVVKATIKDTSDSSSTVEEIDFSDLSFSRSTELEYTAADVGNQNQVEVSYEGHKAYFNVQVKDVELDHLEYEGSPVSTYIEGERFDIGTLVITGVYNDGSEREITDYRLFIGSTLSNAYEISKTEVMNLQYASADTIWVMYDTKTKELTDVALSVSAKQIQSIDELTGDFSLDFTIGTSVNFGSLTAMISFDNGQIDSIDKTNLAFFYKDNGVWVPFDETKIFEEGEDGTYEFKIEYTYAQTTVEYLDEITVSMPEQTGIELVISDIDKQLTVGNTWILNDVLTVKPVYENGLVSSTDITTYTTLDINFLDNSNKVILGGGTYGDRTFRVQADGFEASMTVSIIPNANVEVLTAGLDDNPVPIFRVGDTFDKSKLKVMGIYVGEKEAVRIYDFETIPQNGTLLKSAGIKEIVVAFGGKQAKTSINVLSASDSGLTVTNRYKLVVGNVGGTMFTSFNKDGEIIQLGIDKDATGKIIGGKALLFDENYVDVDTDSSHKNTYGYNVLTYTGQDWQDKAIGYIVFGTLYKENAHVVLFEDPVNPIEGDGNITVTFPHYVEGYADRINKSKFGKIYNKRLFVSGNPDFKNCDWHTSPINTAQVNNADYDLDSGLDFTYFSDLDYCFYGSDDTAVMGYTIFRDGDLIVSKESSNKEATLYRRSATTISAIDYSGSKVDGHTEEAYPMFDINGNGGEGAINTRGITDFVGDCLMLTRNGVKVITAKENISNNAKYTVDVSSYINPRITEELEGSYLYTFREELYLVTTRGVYVGYYENRNENNEYEWYFLKGYKPRMLFELDDEIYFGQDDGKLGRYRDDYIDKFRTYVGVGGVGLSVNIDTDEITLVDENVLISNDYKEHIKEGNDFHLISHYSMYSGTIDERFEIHGNLGWFLSENTKKNTNEYADTKYVGTFGYDSVNNYWFIELDLDRLGIKHQEYFDGRAIYLDKTTSNYYINYKYYLSEIITNQVKVRRYKIVKYTGEPISLSGEEKIRISYRVSEVERAKISDVSEDRASFKLRDGLNNVIDLILYNDAIATYSGVISENEPFKAYFITRPYDMGSISTMKNIWSWFIANDTNLASAMDIGYLASRYQSNYTVSLQSVKGAKQLDYSGGYAFDRIHFTSDRLPRVYTKHRAIPNVAFIRFMFENNEDVNMVLTKLSVVYTFGTIMKGVK